MNGSKHSDNASPYVNGGGPNNPALLLESESYNITWKHADENYPVHIQWLFGDDTDGGQNSLKWEMNTTEGYFLFTPGDILGSFPTPHAPDLSLSAARVGASHFNNLIRISQPEAPHTTNNGEIAQISQQFAVYHGTAEQWWESAVDRQVHDVNNRWRRGVGIGVGVGVPVLMGLTAAATHMATKRHDRNFPAVSE